MHYNAKLRLMTLYLIEYDKKTMTKVCKNSSGTTAHGELNTNHIHTTHTTNLYNIMYQKYIFCPVNAILGVLVL